MRRCLAQIRQVRASGIRLRGVQTLVLTYTFPSCLPGPTDLTSAAAVPALSGLLTTLHPRPGDRAALSFTSLLR